MPSDTLSSLRKQLRQKFPNAHRPQQSASAQKRSPSQAPADSLIPDFPSGAISEISPAHPASGLSLIIPLLLSRQKCGTIVIIDAQDRFDPASFTPQECTRLLWLRCHQTLQALQAADLLLRDGNLPHIILDLSAHPARELQRIPTSSWHRLRQLAESTATTLIALTPVPLIPRSTLRLSLTQAHTLNHLPRPRHQLLPTLTSS